MMYSTCIELWPSWITNLHVPPDVILIAICAKSKEPQRDFRRSFHVHFFISFYGKWRFYNAVFLRFSPSCMWSRLERSKARRTESTVLGLTCQGSKCTTERRPGLARLWWCLWPTPVYTSRPMGQKKYKSMHESLRGTSVVSQVLN